MASGHSCSKIAIISVTAVSLVLTLFFSYLSSAGSDLIPGLYVSNISEISYKYNLVISPANWTFQIWQVIFAFQLAWMGYALSTICRKYQGDYLYRSPNHLPASVYILYLLNLLTVISWTFVWDREYKEAAFALLAACAILTFSTLGTAAYYLNRSALELVLNKQRGDIIATVLLVHNGLGILGTWESMATTIGLGVVLRYTVDMDPELVGTICLCIIAGLLLVWMLCTHLIFERYTRYVFTPHLVVIVAVAGIVSDNYAPPGTNPILMMSLLVFAAFALLLKIGHVVYVSSTSPLYGVDRDSKYVTTIQIQ